MVESLTLEAPFSFDKTIALRLMRRQINPKEAFTVRDAGGAFYRASLKDLSPRGGIAVVYERLSVSPEPSVEITLACAVLARQRMIFIMQKATELGASCIVPLLTDCSVPAEGLEHEKAHAWPGQIIRAAKQCRRSSLPQIMPPTTLEAFLTSPKFLASDLKFYLDDHGPHAVHATSVPRSIVLCAGPEGGFSDTERRRLESAAVPWRLGGRVLRAETAVMVGLVAIHLTWGDYRL
ncbi:16S rRNA (uracil(1498)-N(3))-methyltransferase [Candidatus Fermentibacteria bacterium]|nr:16S rRNA (uracil(1498)-N(3))-methyltransferase [Candidatus Fermentibacteria bacterium]